MPPSALGRPRLRGLRAWRNAPLPASNLAVRPRVRGTAKGACYIEMFGFLAILAQKISMKIHEYQAKAILGQYNVPVPRGEVAFTLEDAAIAAKQIGGSVVGKAQIHAGGRGQGGG